MAVNENDLAKESTKTPVATKDETKASGESENSNIENDDDNDDVEKLIPEMEKIAQQVKNAEEKTTKPSSISPLASPRETIGLLMPIKMPLFGEVSSDNSVPSLTTTTAGTPPTITFKARNSKKIGFTSTNSQQGLAGENLVTTTTTTTTTTTAAAENFGIDDRRLSPRSKLQLHLDDSSDEEDEDVMSYDVDDAWERFESDKNPPDRVVDNVSIKSRHAFSFSAHFIGIQLLYGQMVNEVYYENKRKYLVQKKEALPSEMQIHQWIEKSVETVFACFVGDSQKREREKLQIIDFLSRSANIRFLFRAIDRVDISLQLRENIFKEGLKFAQKIDPDQQFASASPKKLVYTSASKSIDVKKLSDFERFILQLLRTEAEKSSGSKRYFKNLLEENYQELLEYYVVSFDPSNKEAFLKSIVSNNELALPKSNSSNSSAILFYYLLVRELQKNFSLLRFSRPTLPNHFSFRNDCATTFFSNIRLSNRSITREARAILDMKEGVKVINSINKATRVAYSMFKSWEFRSNNFQFDSTAIDSQTLQCQFNEIDGVMDIRALGRANIVAREGTYSKLIPKISDLGGAAIVAKLLRNYVNSSLIFLKNGKIAPIHKDDKDFYADLAYHFFGLEPTRNPAVFVLNQMLLDLIIFAKYEWSQVIDLMPMKSTGAVPAARKLNRMYNPYMPHHYEYPGDDVIQDGYTEVKLINKESTIVILWLQHVAQRPDLLREPENKMLQLHGLIMARVKDWYRRLIPIENPKTNTAASATTTAAVAQPR